MRGDSPACTRYVTLSIVHSLRNSAIVRAVAILLLVWTAADLTDAGLCALDQEGTGAPLPTHTTVIRGVPGGYDNPGSRSAHVDDCFCCSHCVDSSGFVVVHAAPHALTVVRCELFAGPRSIPRLLDHPPQLLS